MTNLIAEIGKVLPKSRVAKSSEMKTKVTTTMFSGCGMNTKELEGIIEKYCDLLPFDELEDFDVYTEGHPNAVIYDAIQEYVDKNNISNSTSEQSIVDLFYTIYQVAQKAQYRRDLWIYRKTMEQEIYEKTRKLIGSWDYSGNEMNNYEPDVFAESIVTGAVIFLLSNQPNQSPRYRRDLKKLEERYAKDTSFTDYDPAIDCLYECHVPPFLPYLWRAIEEASINNAVLEDEIVPEILEGNQPTIIEEVRKLEVAKEEQAQPSASPAQKTTTRIFTCEEEEERQTDIVRKFIADNNITAPLDGSMRNPTLAMIHYFYTKWDKKRGMLRRDIIMQDVLDFFIQKCGVVKKKQKSGELTKDKSITEKINALKRQDIELKPTDEIEEIKKTIEKL